MISTMTILFSSNLKQAVYQKEKIESYYIAQAGIEIAMASLLNEDASGLALKDEITIGYSEGPIDLVLENGKASMTIAATGINGNGNTEILITSIGSLNDSTVTYNLSLTIDATNPAIVNWN